MVDQIKTLLLSNLLPTDLIVQEIFSKHLSKNLSPLTAVQKDSITNQNFYFRKILMKYYNVYDHNPSQWDFFLNMLDNDLCIAINEGHILNQYKSEYLQKNPLVLKSLLTVVSIEDLPEYLHDTWCILSNEKKLEVYNCLMLRFEMFEEENIVQMQMEMEMQMQMGMAQY